MKLNELIRIAVEHPYTTEGTNAIKQIHHMYEGLIRSYHGGYVVGKLKEQYPMISFKYNSKMSTKFDMFINPNTITIEQFDNLLKLLNNYGWYCAGIFESPTQDTINKFDKNSHNTFIQSIQQQVNTKIQFQCEAKFDLELEHKLIPNTLYHATPTKYVKKILKLGIVPTTKNPLFAFPDRIYLAYNYNDLITTLLPYMANKSKIYDWSIFEINTASLKQNVLPIRKWFRDPNYVGGIYTMTNISPLHIKLIKQFQIT